MQHSIKLVGHEHEEVSRLRGDNPPFTAEGFLDFTRSHQNKYNAIPNGDDLLVSTWFISDLLFDYKQSLCTTQ